MGIAKSQKRIKLPKKKKKYNKIIKDKGGMA